MEPLHVNTVAWSLFAKYPNTYIVHSAVLTRLNMNDYETEARTNRRLNRLANKKERPPKNGEVERWVPFDKGFKVYHGQELLGIVWEA